MDAARLLSTPLDDLLAEAQVLRAAGSGRVITYSPKVFIPLTKLCRDVCHYCTFAQPPRRGERAYLTPDEVLAVAREGAAAGCHEALFTLGDKPELRYRAAREELAELGCRTTIEYLARMCRLVLEETGLLPHPNPGVMTAEELALLRTVSVSQGIMLETSSVRLSAKGGPHYGSPDKVPAARLETITAAGRLGIPFTTGILIGIGETRAERLDALVAIRTLHERHGHIQEVIVQNFRAKPGTKMAAHPEPPLEELLWTAAAARILLGPGVNVQAPPNLSYEEFPRLLDAGINDWGGISPVTIDHVNPEAPWPEVDRLRAATEARGLELVPRLPLYPEYARHPERWCDERVAPHVLRASDADGLARAEPWTAGAAVSLPAWAAPDEPGSPGLLPESIVTRRVVHVGNGSVPGASSPLTDAHAKVREGVELEEDDITALFGARGRDLGAVLRAADELRREVCGDTVSYVVTRNVNYTNVCYFRCGFCAFSKGKLAANLRGPRVRRPDRRDRAPVLGGVGPRRGRDLPAGRHPPGLHRGQLRGDLRRRETELPDLHVHAFSALEIWQGAATLGLRSPTTSSGFATSAWPPSRGPQPRSWTTRSARVLCPDKVNTAQWLEVHDAAHRVGLRSTTTIMFGSVEGPRSWARHLLRLRDQQRVRAASRSSCRFRSSTWRRRSTSRGGPPGPDVPRGAPDARRRPTGAAPVITNIQASWVKLGVDGAQARSSRRSQRSRRDAHERVDLTSGGREPRAGDAAGADGEPAIRAPGPNAPTADNALRDAGSGANESLLRRRAPRRARQPRRQRGRAATASTARAARPRSSRSLAS